MRVRTSVPQTVEEWVDAFHEVPEDARGTFEWVFPERLKTAVLDSLRRIHSAAEVTDALTLRYELESGAVLEYPLMVLGCPVRLVEEQQ